MPNAEPRDRYHQWTDPGQLAEITRAMSGREFFDAWRRGEVVPPMAATLDFDLADFGDGHVEITCVPDEFHYSPYGMVHGGLAASLLDTATGCAVHTRLPAGTVYATLNLNVSFMRALTHDTGTVRCIGEVASMGSRVAVAEAELIDASDRTLARATSTCLIIKPNPSRT